MNVLGFGTTDANALFFSHTSKRGSERLDVTVVYVAEPLPSALELSRMFADYFDEAPSPSQIWILGPSSSVAELQGLATAPSLRNRVPEVTRYVESPDILVATLDSQGAVDVAGEGQPTRLPEAETRALFARGMMTIFTQRDGLLRSGPGYHYIKPSGTHTTAFLRTANVLVTSTELSFVALALYARTAGAPIRRIYTDSSSINAVAYALVEVHRKFTPAAPPPVIQSFGSYPGIAEGRDIERGEDNWVLISASTSGDLARQLSETFGTRADRILTLYFVGDTPSSGAVCDLTLRGNTNPSGLVHKFDSWAGDCPLCQRHQSTVSLVGDQLLPANPSVTPHMLVKSDAPQWLSPAVYSMYGTESFQTHAHDGARGGRVRSVVLSLSNLLEPSSEASNSELARRLDRVLLKSIPAATEWLIHLDDPDSLSLAELARERLRRAGIELADDHVLSLDELTQSNVEMSGVVLVVASTVVTGRSVLSVSRALRAAHSGGALAYIFIVPRMAQGDQWRELQSNLAYGDNHPREHNVAWADVLYLPYDQDGSVWLAELDTWTLVREFLETAQLPDEDLESLRSAVEQREAALLHAPAAGGLKQQTFLPSYSGNIERPLRLRPNFAFWAWDYREHPSGTTPSQPEVYATISMLMHHLRSSDRGLSGSLVKDHNWRVLAPRNFSRYNDGIIQASLLRSIVGQECDYAASEPLSRDMADVLIETVSRWASQDGEGAAEMLLAVASNRVRLSNNEHERFRNSLDIEGMPDLLLALCLFVRGA